MAQITCDTMGCTSEDVHEVYDGYATLNLCGVHDAIQQVNGKMAYVARIALALQELGDFTLDLGPRGRVSSEVLLNVCNWAADGLGVRRENLEEAAAMEERVLRAG